MAEMDRSFSGSMPEFYDRYLVPTMFGPFAEDLAERLSQVRAGRLLELAAGTGIVTRALVRTLRPAVEIVATDLNPAMLKQAKTHSGVERVTWREADAQALPFPDAAFDHVLCQFGVMFFPDKPAAFRQARRVLRPGGRFLFNVWGDRTGTPRRLVEEAVGRALGRDPASLVAPEYNDVATVKAALAAAGFTHAGAESVTKETRSASAREAAIANVHGGLLRAHIDKLAPGRLDAITDAVEAALSARYGTGAIVAPLQSILFTARVA